AYGAVGAVVVLLLWFFVSAFVIIIGAVLDAEIEHQTNVDSTIGPDAPQGERGAYVADHEGPIP
ncbi:MAG: YhjD/YihY/BrkB family envelope integrity protein, partial [Polyangiales bacterium]